MCFLSLVICKLEECASLDSNTGWKADNDFDLPLELEMEWENYCTELSRTSITLTDSMDYLLWDEGDNSDHISIKNLYSAIANTTWLHNIYGWRKQFWSWKIPLKIKLFTWISLENKIPTWDSL
jgi:hypothetical protein